MNAHVFTMTTSASSTEAARSYPAAANCAVSLSESTSFLAQPSVVSHTVGASGTRRV